MVYEWTDLVVRKAFLEELVEVRKSRLGRVEGRLVPGVSALAAPVFNLDGQIVAAIGLLGRDVDLDLSVTVAPPWPCSRQHGQFPKNWSVWHMMSKNLFKVRCRRVERRLWKL